MPKFTSTIRKLSKILGKLLFAVTLITLVAGFSIPLVKTNLGLKSDNIDIIFPIGDTSIVFPNLPISQSFAQLLQTIGFVSLALLIVVIVVFYDPINYIREIKHKSEIGQELNKMNKTLESLKKFK